MILITSWTDQNVRQELEIFRDISNVNLGARMDDMENNTVFCFLYKQPRHVAKQAH